MVHCAQAWFLVGTPPQKENGAADRHVLKECPKDLNSAPCCVRIPMQVTLKPEQTILPLVDEALQHTTTKGIVFQHPEIVAHMDLVRQELHLEPFYWKLPEQFEGKKVKDKNFKVI